MLNWKNDPKAMSTELLKTCPKAGHVSQLTLHTRHRFLYLHFMSPVDKIQNNKDFDYSIRWIVMYLIRLLPIAIFSKTQKSHNPAV